MLTLRTSVSVGLRFHKLLARSAPTSNELDKAQLHVRMIRTRLAQRFQLYRARQVGSHWKGTAIREFSDLDLLVIMSREEVRKWARDENSNTILARIRNDLQQRFHSTGVRRDGQAVVVNFSRGDHAVDVVPAIFGNVTGTVSYYIPDGQGSWLETYPDAEKRHLLACQTRSGNKLLSLIRIAKWWASSRSTTASLKSRYIENFIPRCGVLVGMSYSQTFAHVLQSLCSYRCKALSDPLGLTDEVTHIAATDQQRLNIYEALEVSSDRAVRAVDAEAKSDWQEALRLWSIVFNHDFPS